jgi:hypothetical protein
MNTYLMAKKLTMVLALFCPLNSFSAPCSALQTDRKRPPSTRVVRSGRQAKDNGVAQVLKAYQSLVRIAHTNTSEGPGGRLSASKREAITKLVAGVKGAEYVSMLAKVCRATMGREWIDDVTYDRVFEVAFWKCVESLSADRTEAAHVELIDLSERCGLQAGDKLRIRKYVDGHNPLKHTLR